MIVVCDTSPVTNLIQIDQLNLLQSIFGVVILPQAVYDELCAIPEQKTFLDNQNWIFVQKPINIQLITDLEDELDPGEAEAIALQSCAKYELTLGIDSLAIVSK